jgi:8-oxo-dGTP pyrophosphatase MutT (NUDIX family)
MSPATVSIKQVKKNLFWLVSRVAFWTYRNAPIFGPWPASVGIIQDRTRFLVIRRNDGRGLSFPGGLAWPWETEEQTLVREVREETGLRAERCEFVFRYESLAMMPARIAVFRAQVTGEIRNSWEGIAEWVEIAELQKSIISSQTYIVERLAAGSV